MKIKLNIKQEDCSDEFSKSAIASLSKLNEVEFPEGFPAEINVSLVKKVDKDRMGVFNPDTNIISLSEKGCTDEEFLIQTFFHEAFHTFQEKHNLPFNEGEADAFASTSMRNIFPEIYNQSTACHVIPQTFENEIQVGNIHLKSSELTFGYMFSYLTKIIKDKDFKKFLTMTPTPLKTDYMG